MRSKASLDKAVDALKSALSEDKRPIAFLLGAGCPVAINVGAEGDWKPLVPAIVGLTEEVSKAIGNSGDSDRFEKLLAGLKEDGYESPNIEHMLTRVRSLAAVAGSASVRSLASADLDALELAITREISTRVSVSLPEVRGPYDALAAWVAGTPRTYPIHLFTTNYDLLLEEAMERLGVPYFDGFVGSREPSLDVQAMERDELPPRWSRIWKLHGSVNWRVPEPGRVIRMQPHEDDDHRLIHPSHMKYEESRRMPYLAMFDRLRDFLTRPSASLVIVGYSFGDQHINELLVDGLRGNASAMAFGLLHGNREKNSVAFDLAGRRPNLAIYAKDAACIGTRVGAWSAEDDTEIECLLGDFQSLGELLESQVGASSDAT